jgi:hypothetical protein
MKRHIRSVMVLALIILTTVFCDAWAQSQTQTAQTIVFSVMPPQKGKIPSAAIIDPIVLIRGSTLKEPPHESDEDKKEAVALFDQFEKNQYNRGHRYSLLLGGSPLGIATVLEPADVSCFSTTATVNLSVPIRQEKMVLAVNSTGGFGLHANWRMKASAEERAIFVGLAADYLGKSGVKNVQTSAINVDSLYATKLGPTEPDALVGNVTLKQETGLHQAFLLATKKDGKFSVALSSYHTATDSDDASQATESFLDQLDLDHDGVDEIITLFSYYESWEYGIYKLQHGKWERIYKGGGGGC